jgi:metal-sulfur cluster biosynthetic enzyme
MTTSGTDNDVQAATEVQAPTDGRGVTDAQGATDVRPAAGSADRAAAALPEPPAPRADLASLDDVEEAMRDVVDPELGINVVDLGLVYDLRVDEDNTAIIDMTLTSAACPLTDVIEDQARSALVGGPGSGLVNDIKINWVWIPPWGPEKITEDGREQLRALGFTV